MSHARAPGSPINPSSRAAQASRPGSLRSEAPPTPPSNSAIHVAAIVQIRHDTPGRDYYRRKLAAGKSKREALRCLKRRITNAIWRQLQIDAQLDPVAQDNGWPRWPSTRGTSPKPVTAHPSGQRSTDAAATSRLASDPGSGCGRTEEPAPRRKLATQEQRSSLAHPEPTRG